MVVDGRLKGLGRVGVLSPVFGVCDALLSSGAGELMAAVVPGSGKTGVQEARPVEEERLSGGLWAGLSARNTGLYMGDLTVDCVRAL